MSFKTPLLLIVFNRPDKTNNLLKILEEIKPKNLYISADGPRKNSTKDIQLCQEVRKIFDNINWECNIHKKFSDNNLSCKKNVIDSINWFFSKEEQGIILEDDCLPSNSFFSFCENLLNYYADNPKIMQINGTNLDVNYNGNFPHSYFFSKFNHVWGWASWRRAWQLFDENFENYENAKTQGKILEYFEDKNIANWMIKYFDAAYHKKDNIWSSNWAYTILKYNAFCATPSKNLVKNIGFDGSGTSGKARQFKEYSNTMLHEINKIVHPQEILYNLELDKLAYYEKINKVDPRASKKNKLKFFIKKIFRI